MSLFFSLLPIYLFGNLHCLGMCGPLVALLGKHPSRYLYFLGRTLSFSLAGLVAGEVGVVFNVTFQTFKLPAISALVFGSLIVLMGCFLLLGHALPGSSFLARKLAPLSQKLSLLMGKKSRAATFAFGFLTVALPCGQTMLVFSACAVFGSPLVGLINGFVFALLTSPALVLAMHSISFFPKKIPYNKVLGFLSIGVGILALLRGAADLELLPHYILNPKASSHMHIALY